MSKLDELINAEQASAVLGVNPRTVARFARTGVLKPVTKLGGKTGAYVFDPIAVEALAAERRAASETDR